MLHRAEPRVLELRAVKLCNAEQRTIALRRDCAALSSEPWSCAVLSCEPGTALSTHGLPLSVAVARRFTAALDERASSHEGSDAQLRGQNDMW